MWRLVAGLSRRIGTFRFIERTGRTRDLRPIPRERRGPAAARGLGVAVRGGQQNDGFRTIARRPTRTSS
ncbi:hypothetical protein PSMK_08670 [Phycisphaera mikurensis NBRC 102666]|uniref:Uncharacterized protein n=1 Tax=Phycisphaera mikurensis (strain NBRC 102666 / KCTC 22515 / FYK2301M01) TaxID=1142394 RepID=I0ICN8_PHYMF|nr:hypothetical protein PSMK_08670 [Phycisphaera mikurensis NBRC 102666]